jgi:hypothetical protein
MTFRKIGRALVAALALACLASPAAADNYPVRDGAGASQTFCSKLATAVQHPCHLLEVLFGGVPGQVSAGQAAKANSLPVTLPSDPDTRSGSGTITAADAASTTVAGQSSVTLVTGTPTASSSLVWPLNGHSSATIAVSGTFSATAAIESSADGGVTYAPATAKILGTGATSGTVTAPGIFRVDVTGMTHVRLRATAYTSGTLTALANASAAPGLSQVLNPVRLGDASGAVLGVAGNAMVQRLDAVASTNGSGTVTTGGTYQTVFAANSSRKGCTVYNPPAATEVLNVRQAGAIVWPISPGGHFNCSSPGIVVSDLIEVTAATTSHAYTAAQQ